MSSFEYLDHTSSQTVQSISVRVVCCLDRTKSSQALLFDQIAPSLGLLGSSSTHEIRKKAFCFTNLYSMAMKIKDQPAPFGPSYFVPSHQKHDLESATPVLPSAHSPRRRRGWYFVVPVVICAIILGAVLAVILREKAPKDSSGTITPRSALVSEPGPPKPRFQHTVADLDMSAYNSTAKSSPTLASSSNSSAQYARPLLASNSTVVGLGRIPHEDDSTDPVHKSIIIFTVSDASTFKSDPLLECADKDWGKDYFDCYCKHLPHAELCRLENPVFLLHPNHTQRIPLPGDRPLKPLIISRDRQKDHDREDSSDDDYYLKALTDSIEDLEDVDPTDRRVFFLHHLDGSSVSGDVEGDTTLWLRKLDARKPADKGVNGTDLLAASPSPLEPRSREEGGIDRGSDWENAGLGP